MILPRIWRTEAQIPRKIMFCWVWEAWFYLLCARLGKNLVNFYSIWGTTVEVGGWDRATASLTTVNKSSCVQTAQWYTSTCIGEKKQLTTVSLQSQEEWRWFSLAVFKTTTKLSNYLKGCEKIPLKLSSLIASGRLWLGTAVLILFSLSCDHLHSRVTLLISPLLSWKLVCAHIHMLLLLVSLM